MKTGKTLIVILLSLIWISTGFSQAQNYPNRVVYNNCNDGCKYISIDFISKADGDTVNRFIIEDNDPFAISKNEIAQLPGFRESVPETWGWECEQYAALRNQGENFGILIYSLAIYSVDGGDLICNYSQGVALDNNGQVIWTSGILKLGMGAPIISKDGRYVGFKYGTGGVEHSIEPASVGHTIIIDIVTNDTIYRKESPPGAGGTVPFFADSKIIFPFEGRYIYEKMYVVFDPATKTIYETDFNTKEVGKIISVDSLGFTTKKRRFNFQEDFQRTKL